MRAARRALVGVVTAVLVSLLAPPTAEASVGLAPGMPIFTNGGSCSLGFLATNSHHDRLAVTAGHCASRLGERVYDRRKNLIGEVVSHRGDTRRLTDGLGVTVIQLARGTYTADAFFTKYNNPSVGDSVRKYGETTHGTNGRITEVSINAKNPRHSVMFSTLAADHGDSGSPWYGRGPTLYGITIGNNDPKGLYGFPIRALIQYVREGSDRWGPGFLPVGK